MSTGIPVWNKSVRSFASAWVSPRMEASFEAYQVAGITVNRSLVVKLCLKSLDAFITVHILIHIWKKYIFKSFIQPRQFQENYSQSAFSCSVHWGHCAVWELDSWWQVVEPLLILFLRHHESRLVPLIVSLPLVGYWLGALDSRFQISSKTPPAYSHRIHPVYGHQGRIVDNMGEYFSSMMIK